MIVPALSVVIPTYQRCRSLKRALDALGRQTLPPDRYEVIVSVDGSTDGTIEMLASVSPPFPLRVVRRFPNHGRASACNRGLEESRGDLVVLLDDDMEPTDGFLEAHLRWHHGHAKRGVLGAVPIQCDASATPTARYIARKFNGHLQNLARGIRIEPRAFYTGNFSIRRAVLLEAGAFDEGFTIYGNEDVDLALRLRSRGVHLVYAADACARQHYEKGMSALAHDQMSKGRTAVLLAGKHPEAAAKTRLASYGGASRRWRAIRAALLACARPLPWAVALLIRGLDRLDRRNARGLDRWLPHVADYFFWLGVASALPRRRWLSIGAGVAALTGEAQSS